MKKINDTAELRKIPLLTDDELKELARAMYSNDDELQVKRFWKKVYEKRGLEYPEGEQKCLGAK